VGLATLVVSLTGVVEVVEGVELLLLLLVVLTTVGLTATMLSGIICCELAGAYRIVPAYGEGELKELVVRQDDEFDEELDRGGDEWLNCC